MQKRRQNVGLGIFALLLALSPRPAAAQDAASSEIFAGYSFVHEAGIDHLDFPIGWNVSAALKINGWLALAGDIDGHRKTLDLLGSEVRLTSHAFLAGLRASATLGSFTEYGEVLAGWVRATGTVFGATDTTNHAALQPALGLDRAIGRRLSVRVEGAVRFIDSGQEVRVSTGVAYRFP
jgi:hypothetical protein